MTETLSIELNIDYENITFFFMQGIYTYISETNHVPKEHNVAGILSLLFIAPISLVPALVLI
jgi:hypothetical protein